MFSTQITSFGHVFYIVLLKNELYRKHISVNILRIHCHENHKSDCTEQKKGTRIGIWLTLSRTRQPLLSRTAQLEPEESDMGPILHIVPYATTGFVLYINNH
jgi:hypothetical protein